MVCMTLFQAPQITQLQRMTRRLKSHWQNDENDPSLPSNFLPLTPYYCGNRLRNLQASRFRLADHPLWSRG